MEKEKRVSRTIFVAPSIYEKAKALARLRAARGEQESAGSVIEKALLAYYEAHQNEMDKLAALAND